MFQPDPPKVLIMPYPPHFHFEMHHMTTAFLVLYELVRKKKFKALLIANLAIKTQQDKLLTENTTDKTSSDTKLLTTFKQKEAALEEMKSARKTMFEEVFNYFEQLIAESLTPQWVDIVQDECYSENYIKLSGRNNTSGKREAFVGLV